MPTKTSPRVPPSLNPKPISRAELERRRGGVTCVGPSGNYYKVRQVNLQRHALAGGLPTELLNVALQGTKAMGKALTDPDTSPENFEAMSAYQDNVVLATIVEPQLTKEDLGEAGKLDDDPVLPATDFQWALELAFGETEHDGEGRRIWGPEPLSSFRVFRDVHECEEGCEACAQLVTLFSVLGERGA